MTCESLEGPSDMTTLHGTEVNAVSATLTVESDMLTSTQESLQVLEDSDHSEDDTLVLLSTKCARRVDLQCWYTVKALIEQNRIVGWL